MSVAIVGYPKFKAFIDGSGSPLVGGKLYTLTPGATGPLTSGGVVLNGKTSYTDTSGGTPNTNPVILDGNGECDVCFNDRAKLVLTDSNDVQLWSVDNVLGSSVTSDVLLSLTGDQTLTSDHYLVDCNAASAEINVTPPAVPNTGQEYIIVKTDSSANAVTIVATVSGVSSPTLTTQYSAFHIIYNGTSWEFIGMYRNILRLLPGAVGTARQTLVMNSGATALEWVASMQSLLTAQGDMIYASAANTPARLAKGLAGQIAQMNAAETAPEWTSSVFVNSLPAVDLAYSGPHTTLIAAENLAFGDACYMNSSGKMAKGDADAIATSGVWVMAAATILQDASGDFILPGAMVRKDAWNWTIGSFVYLDTATAGGLTQTPPTGTDDAIQIVGVARSADMIFFMPQLLMYTHT